MGVAASPALRSLTLAGLAAAILGVGLFDDFKLP
jgi:hypothetical protein